MMRSPASLAAALARSVVGLIVDDGLVAVGALAALVTVAGLAQVPEGTLPQPALGLVLFVLVVLALLASVAKAARSARQETTAPHEA